MTLLGRVITIGTLAAVMAAAQAAPAGAGTTPAQPPVSARIGAGVVEALEQGPAEVLVQYDAQAVTARAQAMTAASASHAARSAATRTAIEGYTVVKRRSLAAAGTGTRVMRHYHALPLQLVRIDSAQTLRRLAGAPGVRGVSLPQVKRLTADPTPSLTLIGQPDAVDAGHTGDGYQVAVLDTGVNYELPSAQEAFGDCSSGPGGEGCRVNRYVDVTNSGELDVDSDMHGTNVSGIVATVAPEAELSVYNVFSVDPYSDSLGAMDDDIFSALDDVAQHAADLNIRAVNMSLGTDEYYTSECSDSDYSSAFGSLRALGVLPVVAAGNSAYGEDGFTSGVAAPACATGAVRVGAVYAQDSDTGSWGSPGCTDTSPGPDTIACFSQTGPLLSLLAPGVDITAAGITQSGTSQATPHVAGSVAVLADASPEATADQIQQALVSTGPVVEDERDGTRVHRLQLDQAANAVQNAVTLNGPKSRLSSGTVEITGTAPAGTTVTVQRKNRGASDDTYATVETLTADSTSGTFDLSVKIKRSTVFRAVTEEATSNTVLVKVRSKVSFSKDKALGGGKYLLRANGAPDASGGTMTFYKVTSSSKKKIATVKTNSSGVGRYTWKTSKGTKKVRVYYTAPGCEKSEAAKKTIRVR